MKLPADKAERTKMLVLMAIGVGATIYVLVCYAVLPIIKANKENAERIATVKEILIKADMEVKLIHRDKEANALAMQEIRKVSENHLLHPSMGINYQIPASEVIGRIEKQTGLSLNTPVGSVAAAIPGPGLPPMSELKSFGMNVNLSCSHMTLVGLINTIRAENPHIVISRISITAQDKTPKEHSVSFLMSWPIWADPKMVDTIKGWTTEGQPEGGNKP